MARNSAMPTRSARTALIALLMGLIASGVAVGGPVKTGWVPSNAGVMWWQPDDPWNIADQPPGETDGGWFVTRRLASSPHIPGLMHMGSLLHGAYVTDGGGAWSTLTPGCMLPSTAPIGTAPIPDAYQIARTTAIAAPGLDVCGVETIVYDPVLPTRIYASAYDVSSIVGYSVVLEPGGVYVSNNLGATWRKLLSGIRGNGLAVRRASATAPARIAVGYIQWRPGQPGNTPSNGSVSISDNDGETWRHVTLPPSGCPDVAETSQRITPTIVMHPTDPNRMWLGTNAGLYGSTDGGFSFTPQKLLCRGTWGLSLSASGSTLYVGDADGKVWRAPTSTMNFAQVATLSGGKIQSVMLDARDERWLYAVTWSNGAADGHVYRVDTLTGAVARLESSALSQTDASWPGSIPKPFPLVAGMNNTSTPAMFLGQGNANPDQLWVSTMIRGAFFRLD